MLLLQVLLALVLLFFGVIFAAVAIRLMQSDSGAFERNQRRSKSVMSVVRGQADARDRTSPDGICHEAIAVNRRENRWLPQAALSDEAIDSILARKCVE